MFSLHSKFSTQYASGEVYHRYDLLDNAGNVVVHILYEYPVDIELLNGRLRKYIPEGDMIYKIFEKDKDSEEYIQDTIRKVNKNIRMYDIKETASEYEV
jgi:hypothetical protein